MARSRHEHFIKELEWIPTVCIVAQEAQRLITDSCVETFKLEDHKYLDLPRYIKELEDVEYFSVVYARVDNVHTFLPHRPMSSPSLDPRLVKADMLARSCTRAVYTFWNMIQHFVAEDPNIQRVRWMRRNPDPEFVTFAAGSEIAANSHDYFLITYHDGDKFVLNPTAAQFGWTRWLYTRKEYEEKLATGTFDLESVNVKEQIRRLDTGDWRVRATKEMTEKCVERCEKGDGSGELDDAGLPDILADRVRTMVLEALKTMQEMEEKEDPADNGSKLRISSRL